MKKKEFQTIHEIGYPALLEKLSGYKGTERNEILSKARNSAAVLKTEPSSEACWLTASGIYIEGVHFDLVYTPLHHLGYKLITAVTSKILSMNGLPVVAHPDMAIPNKLSVGMLERIYSGFERAGKEFDCHIYPGDTTASHQALAVSVHVSGLARETDIVYRDGCREGDQICVTGDLGGAMAGLRILLREKKSWQENEAGEFRPDLHEYQYVVQRQLAPAARYDFINKLSGAGVTPTSMIELGQGLLNGIQMLAGAGGRGFEIFTPAVPISLDTRRVADEMKEDVDRYAFYGGEDYEMLFTLHPPDVEKLKLEFEDFSVIGHVTPAGEGIVLNTGEGKESL